MWKVDKEEIGSIQCSLIGSPIVYIEPTPRSKIQFLMDEYPHQEWLAYLQGGISEKNNIYVEDISVPPHKERSGTSAEAEPFHAPKNCVGIIHSHHMMGAFHSGTDNAYVDKNYPISIVVARGNQELTYDAVSYQTTLCGKSTVVRCPVKFVSPKPLFDKDEFLREAKRNIDKSKKVYPLGISYSPLFPREEPLGYADFTDYGIDEKGHVLSRQELDNILQSIWKDKKA